MRGRWGALLLCAGVAAGQSDQHIKAALRKLKSNSYVERRAAAVDLGRWRVKKAAKPLAIAWATPRDDVRQAVEGALRSIGPSAFPAAFYALKYKDVELRRAAARLMVEFSREMKSLPVSPKRLVSRLRDEDEAVRVSLSEVVGRSGREAVEPLLALFGDRRVWVRNTAAATLASFGPALMPRLLPLARDESPRVRHGAVATLGAFATPQKEALPAVLRARQDPDGDVRHAAVWALGRMRRLDPERILPLLVASMGDPEARHAADTMLRAAGEEAIPYVVKALGDPKIGPHVTPALVARGENAIEPLLAAAKADDAGVRAGALWCLGRIGADHGLSVIADALCEGLRDPDAKVRLASAQGLSWVPPDAMKIALDALLAAAKDPDSEVRGAALYALVVVLPHDSRVQAAAQRGASDRDNGVRCIAGYAAIRAGGDPAGPLRNLRSAVLDPNLKPAVRVQAVRLLQHLGRRAEPVVDGLMDAAKGGSHPMEVRVAAARALGILVARRGAGFGRRRARYAALEPEVRAAVEKGLRWLASVQLTRAKHGDGRWDSDGVKDGGWAQFDVGLTALSLLAFLATGSSDRTAPWATTVHDGLGYLRSRRTKEGLYLGPAGKHQHFLLEHALATLVFCERMDLVGDTGQRPAIQQSLDLCLRARNPKMAWKYEPRGGTNDTHMTVWMLTTLRVAETCGLAVDPNAYAGGREWIDKMTDPNFGQVGYDYPGGAPCRDKRNVDRFPPERSHSMTAAGVWGRFLVGEDIRRSEMAKKGANLCVELTPEWNTEQGDLDQYYWYFGTLALYQTGGAYWRKWWPELREALLKNQQGDGSWAPEGAWGFAGGRIYSTAIATLTLLTPVRYEVDFVHVMRSPYREAVRALKAVAESGPKDVRLAAEAALERISPSGR